MARTPPDPAPSRTPVLTYATPDIRDVVFYIHVNHTLPSYEEPEYGTPYDGVVDTKERFPDHKLVLVTAADESGWVRWYFAADRKDQCKYNLSYVDPSALQQGFVSYTRVYVIPRDELKSRVGFTVNPNSPPNPDTLWDGEDYWEAEELWTAIGFKYGDPDPDKPCHEYLEDFRFTAMKFREVQDKEIQSLYVFLELTFELIYPIRARLYNPWIGDFVETITKTKLHDEVGFDMIGENGHAIEFRDLNNHWSQEIERPDYEKLKIGTTITGAGFDVASCSAFENTKKYVAAGTVESGVDPITGIVTTTTPVNNVVSVVETSPSTPYLMLGKVVTGSVYDPNSGTVKPVTTTYIPTSEIAESSIDSEGNITEYRPVTPCVAKKIERNVKPFNDVTYNTVVNYSFPRVLGSVVIKGWELLLGGTQYHVSFNWLRNAYSGPCTAIVEEKWTKTPPPTPSTPIGMSTTSIQYACPLFSLSSGPCLAPAITVNVFIGNRDPRFESTVDNYTSTASTLTDWPLSFVAQESVRPLSGGWVHRKVTVFSPL